MLPNMVLPVPFFIMGAVAIAAMRPRKVRPSGASGLSVSDRPSSMSGQQDRLQQGPRPISNRQRNGSRCIGGCTSRNRRTEVPGPFIRPRPTQAEGGIPTIPGTNNLLIVDRGEGEALVQQYPQYIRLQSLTGTTAVIQTRNGATLNRIGRAGTGQGFCPFGSVELVRVHGAPFQWGSDAEPSPLRMHPYRICRPAPQGLAAGGNP